uniref:Uncharacterized protein n=1 Tax=Romanomermis culicivorax TaxID=13658 RepID=A0A915L8T6_ROMCU
MDSHRPHIPKVDDNPVLKGFLGGPVAVPPLANVAIIIQSHFEKLYKVQDSRFKLWPVEFRPNVRLRGEAGWLIKSSKFKKFSNELDLVMEMKDRQRSSLLLKCFIYRRQETASRSFTHLEAIQLSGTASKPLFFKHWSILLFDRAPTISFMQTRTESGLFKNSSHVFAETSCQNFKKLLNIDCL